MRIKYRLSKKKNRNHIFCVILVSCVLALTSCSAGFEDYSASGVMMDTLFSISIRAEGKGEGEATWSEFSVAGKSLENDLLSRRVVESEISNINASAGSDEGYELSPEMEEYISVCLEISFLTEGAFDISIGALADLWNIDASAKGEADFVLPTEEKIEIAKEKCGYEKIKIENHRIYIPEGMIIDLGAVGKGIYLDEAFNIMESKTRYGVVSAGGSILTYGYKSDGSKWKVGIVDPDNESQVKTVLNLEGSNYVSTSGDYERFVTVEENKYHHILDISTGYPADSGISSVTVVIPANADLISSYQGLFSDALSTAIFVMGEEKGLELANSLEIDVMIIRNDGTVVETDEMKMLH